MHWGLISCVTPFHCFYLFISLTSGVNIALCRSAAFIIHPDRVGAYLNFFKMLHRTAHRKKLHWTHIWMFSKCCTEHRIARNCTEHISECDMNAALDKSYLGMLKENLLDMHFLLKHDPSWQYLKVWTQFHNACFSKARTCFLWGSPKRINFHTNNGDMSTICLIVWACLGPIYSNWWDHESRCIHLFTSRSVNVCKYW